MRAFALLLVAPLALLSGFALGQPRAASPDPRAGQRIAETGTAAGAAPCAQCHKPDGSGDPDLGAPRLAGQVAGYFEKQMHDYASGARKNEIMTPIAQALNDAETAEVAAFYAQAQAPYPPVPDVDAALLSRGRSLAEVGQEEKRVQACVNCHGPQGTGLAPDYPYLAGQYAEYAIAQYEAWRQGSRTNDPLAVMRTIFSQLDKSDVDAVAHYFATLRPVPRRDLSVSGAADPAGPPSSPPGR